MRGDCLGYCVGWVIYFFILVLSECDLNLYYNNMINYISYRFFRVIYEELKLELLNL